MIYVKLSFPVVLLDEALRFSLIHVRSCRRHCALMAQIASVMSEVINWYIIPVTELAQLIFIAAFMIYGM
jgi:hypothetical protein